MLIAHLTDLHIRPKGLPAYRVSETNMMSAQAVNVIRALDPAPDCVIISGDLTDCGLNEEYELLKELLRPLKMPVYLIPGNHDRRNVFRQELADFPGVTSDPEFVQYVVDEYPVRLIALDTLVSGKSHGALTRSSLEWLDKTLAMVPAKPTIIFMHHPPFECGIRHMDAIRLLDGAEDMKAIISRHGQVERILCGHHHRPIHTRWAGTICSTGPAATHQVTLDLRLDDPGSMVMEPPAFQLHFWSAEMGLVSHIALVERYPGPFPFVLDKDYPGMTG